MKADIAAVSIWQARGREASEFRHEDITGDRTHCGVCPRCRWRPGGYEQGVQVRSAPLVRTRATSPEGRYVNRVQGQSRERRTATLLVVLEADRTNRRRVQVRWQAPTAHYSPLATFQPAEVSVVENAFPPSMSQPCSLAYRRAASNSSTSA